MEIQNLRTIKQLAEEGPWTVAALRGLVHNADDLGLADAIIRVGRKVLIDKERLERWLDQRRQSSAGRLFRGPY